MADTLDSSFIIAQRYIFTPAPNCPIPEKATSACITYGGLEGEFYGVPSDIVHLPNQESSQWLRVIEICRRTSLELAQISIMQMERRRDFTPAEILGTIR